MSLYSYQKKPNKNSNDAACLKKNSVQNKDEIF